MKFFISPDTRCQCDVCGWAGLVSELLVTNEAWVCPRCESDESGIDLESAGIEDRTID